MMPSLDDIVTGTAPTVIVGCSNALEARVVSDCGGEGVFVSGFAVAANHGLPDVGLVSCETLSREIEAIRQAVDIPIIVDADTGFGEGPLIIGRNVAALVKSGADAIVIEDQQNPKRCGLTAGRRVVPIPDMLTRLTAARWGAEDGASVIARTDALETEGPEGAVVRAHAYAEAGATIVFIEGIQRIEDLTLIGNALGETVPLVLNRTPIPDLLGLTAKELGALGYQIILAPIQLQLASLNAQKRAARCLLDGTMPTDLATVEEVQALVSEEQVRELEENLLAGSLPGPAGD